MKICSETIDLYYDLLCNRERGNYIQNPDGKYRADYGTPSRILVKDLLKGKQTIAFPAVLATLEGEPYFDPTAKWIVFDDDQLLPPDAPARLDTVQKIAEGFRLVGYREGAREIDGLVKQGHLWFFFDKPISAVVAYALLQFLRVKARLGARPVALELFPKSVGGDGLGSALKGPLSRHAKAGYQRMFFRDAGQSLSEQIEFLSKIQRNSSEQIEQQSDLLFGEWERLSFEPVRVERPRRTRSGPSILQLVEKAGWDLREQQDRFIGQCPLCDEEGHDHSKNNLAIALDGAWYGCWYGGWNQHHSWREIYKRFAKLAG